MTVGGGMPRHIIAVTSLAREALIARGNGVSVICSQSCRLSAALKGALSPGVCGIISFGISGGLHPELVAGDWVVASAVRYGDRVFATDSKWTQELAKRLPGAILAEVAGSDVLLATPVAKAHLYKTMGAAAVDMESHISAEIAATHGIPFASCRVIIDSAYRYTSSRHDPGVGLERRGGCSCGDAIRHSEAMPTPGPHSRCVRRLLRGARPKKGSKAVGSWIGVSFLQGTCRPTRIRRPAEHGV